MAAWDTGLTWLTAPSLHSFPGWRDFLLYFFNSAMSKLLFAAISLGLAAVVSAVANAGVEALDSATAAQCAHHDWPADKHQAHIEFCKSYGYRY